MVRNSLKNITDISSGPNSDNPISVKYFKHLLSHWTWFVVSITVSLAGGLLLLRYTTPVYEINASILVKDDSKGTDFGESLVLESLGLPSGKNNVDNEVEILKSRSLMESVVKDLQLHVQYFASGDIKTTEIYEKSPVRLNCIEDDKISTLKHPVIYFLTFKSFNRFTLTDNINTWQQAFGDTFQLPTGRAILLKTTYKPIEEDQYSIQISGLDPIVNEISNNLSVSATNKFVSIIDLKLSEILPLKGETVLKRLIQNYLEGSVTDKNRIANNTISFIDENLALVSNELSGVENEIEKFRTANRMININEQTKLLLENTSHYDKEKTASNIQLRVIESLISFLAKNPFASIPSSLVMQQPDFTANVEKYNSLQLSREQSLASLTSDHPSIQNTNHQLSQIREGLTNSIDARKQDLIISLKALERNSSGFQNAINKLPAKERIFLDFARKQEIKQELYIFLLKKRVETSISKSSTIPNGKIIDRAKANNFPSNPNRKLTMMVSILLGISIPFAFFYLQDIFNTKISEKTEISNFLKTLVVAEIGHSKHPEVTAANQFNRGQVAEQFRVLRTNIQHLSDTKNDKVILITSSMGGEGKTLIAINLCAMMQLTGKKVILVEFDLRKPTIAEYFNLNGKGITEYITSNIEVKDIIQQATTKGPLDVITSGFVPQNPAELIMSPKIAQLFKKLKESYDFIIFDTAPIGLVTDARLLSRFADISLFVIREKFTFRHQLESIETVAKNKLLPNLRIIINDVKSTAGYSYDTYQ